MSKNKGVIIFGIIEIAIGLITVASLVLSLALGKSTKPPEVVIFVLTTSFVSFGLGIGILRRSLTSYHLLLYFASVVILSKILVFANIITLSGALETTIPQSAKNVISIVYHILLIWYFIRPSARAEFGEKRNVLFSINNPFKGK